MMNRADKPKSIFVVITPLFVLVLIFYFFFVIRLLKLFWMRHYQPMYLGIGSFGFLAS